MKPPRPASEHLCSIGCAVPRPLAQQLKTIAEQRGVSLSTVMREALTQSLERRDDRPDD